MQLNLSCCDPDLQRSLVIHEFGHALGLKHEHQRSDFWNVIRKHLDLPKMKSCISVRYSMTSEQERAASGWNSQWDAESASSSTSPREGYEYDPLSIMHYW